MQSAYYIFQQVACVLYALLVCNYMRFWYTLSLWSTYHMIFNTGQAFLNTKWFVFWIRKHVITESNGWDVIYLSSNFPTGNCLALMVDQTEGVGKIKISCFVRQVWVITEVERNCRLSSFQFLSQITQTHQKIHS